MSYQAFDYLLALHHRLSPENDLAELSWVLINTRLHTSSEVVISQVLHLVPPFQMHSFEYIILCLFQTISNIEKDLRSISIVTFNRDLLEIVLPIEASKRNIILPVGFSSFIPLVEDYKMGQNITELAAGLGEHV